MTIEEKAKAYDEALKDMRVIYPNLRGDAKLAVEHAFPVLAESEDERIRKDIIALIEFGLTEGSAVSPGSRTTKEEALAWLEKQKEPENVSASTMIPSCWEVEQKEQNRDGKKWIREKDYNEQLDAQYAQGFEDGRKEQKPDFIVPKRIRPKFAVGDTVCRPMWSDHTIREIYIDCDDPVYICVNEEGTESHISFSEQDEWERKEQKPAEHSAKGRRGRIGTTPEHIRKKAENFLSKMEPPYDADDICTAYEAGALESAKPAEWSEEDDMFMDELESYILYDKEFNDEQKSWRIKRLKSLRPSWKPSEEQIMTLDIAISDYRHACTKDSDKKAETLKSLLEQLKKL